MCNLLSLQCASLFRYTTVDGKTSGAKTLTYKKSAINTDTIFLLAATILAIIVLYEHRCISAKGFEV